MIALPVTGLAMRAFIGQAWQLRQERHGAPLIVIYYAGSLLAVHDVPAGRRARDVLCDQEQIALYVGTFAEHTTSTLKAAVKARLAQLGIAHAGSDKPGLEEHKPRGRREIKPVTCAADIYGDWK